jgi:hypothetical protein
VRDHSRSSVEIGGQVRLFSAQSAHAIEGPARRFFDMSVDYFDGTKPPSRFGDNGPATNERWRSGAR